MLKKLKFTLALAIAAIFLAAVALLTGGCATTFSELMAKATHPYPVSGDYQCSTGDTVTLSDGTRWTDSQACAELACVIEEDEKGNWKHDFSSCDFSFPEDFTQGGPFYGVGQ